MQSYPYLSKPFHIGKLTIKNRFCMAPIGGSQHHLPGGGLKDETIQYLVERARGGFGLIFTGALAADHLVDPYSAVGPSILQNPDAFKMTATELNERASAYGTKIFAQITMGLGRNYPDLPAPSSVHVFRHPGVNSPELTRDQIKSKIESVVKSAKIAKDSGFAGVEVHSIHWGYLLDQFALSMMNYRTDEYGGSLENRLRAAREILEGIKQECGSDFPVSMRLGLKTFVKGFEQATLTGEEEIGRTIEEGVEIAKLLESYGYDCLNVDTGIYDSFYYACPPMYMPKGYLVELAAKAKAAVNIPILAGGRMNDPEIAEAAIRDGKIDAVVMGRAALADPEYPNKVLTGHTEKIRPCIACNQGCIHRYLTVGNVCCAVNPEMGRGIGYSPSPALVKKNIVSVGGGVAGMEAARTCALRGHKVTLFEKSGRLGGNLIPAGTHGFKEEVQRLNQWYQRELKKYPIDVHMNEEAGPEKVKEMGADAVILAVGSSAAVPPIRGVESKCCMSCTEALDNVKPVGDKVVIVGGGLVGCEMDLEYLQEGKKVTIAEALDHILSAGASVPLQNVQMLKEAFEYYQAEILEGHRIIEVKEHGAVVADASGQEKELEAYEVAHSI